MRRNNVHNCKMSISSSHIRIKGLILLMICILVTSLFYCLVGEKKPNFENLVEETHRRLSQPLIKLKEVVVRQSPSFGNIYTNNIYSYNVINSNGDSNINNNKVNSNENDNVNDQERILRFLGFGNEQQQYHQQQQEQWENLSLPLIVTAVRSDQMPLIKGFIKSTQNFNNELNLIIYDLDLDESQADSINKICNTSNSCLLRKFDFTIFPSHISDLNLFAFRPLIIQEALNRTGSVIWLNPDYYLTPDTFASKAKKVIEKARNEEGIQSWTINLPTSSMTHPRMFDYFQTSADNFFFHRMIEPGTLILFNKWKIHRQLMLPWVKCALTLDCIAPIGAQRTGCRFNKKPLYRYSGCHHYDMSALNVLLGVLFNYSERAYAADENVKFFKQITAEELKVLENLENADNLSNYDNNNINNNNINLIKYEQSNKSSNNNNNNYYYYENRIRKTRKISLSKYRR